MLIVSQLHGLLPGFVQALPPLASYSILVALLLSAAAVLFGAYLFVMYPDRALFSKSQAQRPDIPLVAEGCAPVVGNLPLFAEATNYFVEKNLDLARKYGMSYRCTFGFPVPPFVTFNGRIWQDMISVYDPRDVEHVLRDPYKYPKGHDAFMIQKPLLGHGIFSSDGAEWSVQRKVASSIFQVKLFRDVYTPVFQEDARKVCRHLRAAHDLDAAIDLQDLLLRCTMDSFIKIALGVDLGGLDAVGRKDAKGHYVLPGVPFSQAFDSLNQSIFYRSFSPIWNIEEMLSGKSRQIAEWKKTVDDFALRVITEKRENTRSEKAGGSESKGKDLMDLFMATRNDDGSELTNEQLRDVVVNFLIAGRDTTAQTLSWVFWELDAHPTIESRVRAELRTVLGDKNLQLPSYEHLSSLKYTTATFHEVLRLHPNVPLNAKEAAQDDVLPTGIRIQRGDLIQFSPFVMGRLPEIWGSDALDLKPERWLSPDGEPIKHSPFKCPFFNAGARTCLGINMATQEAQTLISAIVGGFHLELVEEDSKEKWGLWSEKKEERKGRYDNQLTLAMRGGVHFKVHLV